MFSFPMQVCMNMSVFQKLFHFVFCKNTSKITPLNMSFDSVYFLILYSKVDIKTEIPLEISVTLASGTA